MYWFRRPPYWRWVAAAVIVIAALAIELRPRPTVLHPFVREATPAGSPVEGSRIEWRELPAGALPLPDLAATVAARALVPGEPVLPSHLTRGVAPPAGWWGVPLPMRSTAGPGTPVLVVIVDPPATIEGVVLESPSDDPLAFDRVGIVAVPGEHAATAAQAAARNAVTVLVSP